MDTSSIDSNNVTVLHFFYVFLEAGKFVPSRCLELYKRYINTQAHGMYMKFSVRIGSDAMKWLRLSSVIWRMQRHKDTK